MSANRMVKNAVAVFDNKKFVYHMFRNSCAIIVRGRVQ